MLLQTCIMVFSYGQITTTRPLSTGTVTKIAQGAGTVAGNFTGTQTNDYGQYPQAISFQLTTAGEFIITTQNGTVAARGTYTFSNNVINGSYRQASSGETYSFTGNYDPSSQKLTCTQGTGTTTKGQGKWIASKITSNQTQPVNATFIKNTSISTQPAIVPAPSPVTTTSTNNTNKFYYLTNVTVRIYTGNDNKESPSLISVNVSLPPGSSNYSIPSNPPGPSLIFSTDGEQSNYRAEIKSNSVSEIKPSAICHAGYRVDEVSLPTITRNGLLLHIYYLPNLFTDAWKIEKVEMDVEFIELNGTRHPTLGKKTITFFKSNVLLTNANNKLALATDKFLIPINQ